MGLEVVGYSIRKLAKRDGCEWEECACFECGRKERFCYCKRMYASIKVIILLINCEYYN